MNDMKDDISNLYLLYTSPQFDTNNLVNSTQELNIDESSSKIVSENNILKPHPCLYLYISKYCVADQMY